jgi:hypothetical protein
VKILLCRGSAQKIATESGTMFPKMQNLSAPNLINQNKAIKKHPILLI